MSAQEQKRKLESKAIRGFIICNQSSVLAGYMTYQNGLFAANDATPVPFDPEKVSLL
jgi:hypothetical protein